MSIPRIIVTVILFLFLTAGYVFTQETEEIIPVTPTTNSPSKEIVVFSFYDTQLELLCYSANYGIFCITQSKLSTHAQAFIKDRVTKYKETTFGRDSIILPRIVPLEN